MKIKRDITSKKFLMMLYWFTLLSFVLPTIYLIVRIVLSENTPEDAGEYRARAEYVLMLIQCVLGIVVIHLPTIISKRFKFEIPKILYFVYLTFLYCAIFLGEVRNFYYVVPHWDDILHCISSIMTGLLGFMMVTILNHDKKVRISLSPFFLALFAFCFAVSVGAIWEIYEYFADELMDLNMQKFMLRDGTQLIGHAALSDTMIDIVVDCCGAFIATIIGYFSIKNKTGWVHEYLAGESNDKDK